jgi:hypothetical protein
LSIASLIVLVVVLVLDLFARPNTEDENDDEGD